MSEKISIQEATGDSFIGRFLLHCIAELSSRENKNCVELFNIEQNEPLNVCLTINNVEVKFSSFMALLDRYHTEFVQKAAMKLVKERLNNLDDRLHNFSAAVKRLMMYNFPEINLDRDW